MNRLNEEWSARMGDKIFDKENGHPADFPPSGHPRGLPVGEHRTSVFPGAGNYMSYPLGNDMARKHQAIEATAQIRKTRSATPVPAGFGGLPKTTGTDYSRKNTQTHNVGGGHKMRYFPFFQFFFFLFFCV
jgi:hypothetical protein